MPSYKDHDPVVQSIVSLTNLFRGQLIKCVTTLYPHALIFFVEKMREAFALQNLSHFFNKKYSCILDINTWNFNETLTNDVLSFKQPGPCLQVLAMYANFKIMNIIFLCFWYVFLPLFSILNYIKSTVKQKLVKTGAPAGKTTDLQQAELGFLSSALSQVRTHEVKNPIFKAQCFWSPMLQKPVHQQ